MKLSAVFFACRQKRWVGAAVLVTCLFVSSCGSTVRTVVLAKKGVEEFHTQLNAAQYAAMYAASDEKLHKASSEADFTKLLEAVHRKLGMVQTSNMQGVRVGWALGQGATVSMEYLTKFSDGSASESFVWHVKDDKAFLYGYNINSNDLITK